MGRRWLILRVDAPLLAFGGNAVDQLRITRELPAASMLAGLLANAIGLRWSDGAAHQQLQDRLVFAACHLRDSVPLTDVQNAQLAKQDSGWTTRGEPEGRKGATYDSPHRRTKEYHADARVRIALRLRPHDGQPALEDLAEALDRPARPLYIGRKACLPAAPLLRAGDGRWITAPTAHAALCTLAGNERRPALWPVGEGPEEGPCVARLTERADLRNWITGYHSGARRVVEGWTS